MPIEIAYCMHRGDTPSQQDALLVDNTVYQSAGLLPCEASLTIDDTMVAIDDGVASSPQAHLASKLVLKTLAAALVQRPEDCVEGMLSATYSLDSSPLEHSFGREAWNKGRVQHRCCATPERRPCRCAQRRR